jgi:hypothetical protein
VTEPGICPRCKEGALIDGWLTDDASNPVAPHHCPVCDWHGQVIFVNSHEGEMLRICAPPSTTRQQLAEMKQNVYLANAGL